MYTSHQKHDKISWFLFNVIIVQCNNRETFCPNLVTLYTSGIISELTSMWTSTADNDLWLEICDIFWKQKTYILKALLKPCLKYRLDLWTAHNTHCPVGFSTFNLFRYGPLWMFSSNLSKIQHPSYTVCAHMKLIYSFVIWNIFHSFVPYNTVYQFVDQHINMFIVFRW